MLMYEENARIYDLVNGGIPYEKEARMLTTLLETCNGDSLLDVACGTGKLISFLDTNRYRIAGIDYSKGMLEVARKQNDKNVQLFQGDMKCFEMYSKYSVVSCLGSAVQYNLSIGDLERTIICLTKHAYKYVIFDVRYCMDKWIDGYVKDKWYEDDKYKVHETWTSKRESVYSIWEPNFYVINKANKKESTYTDYHKIRLFYCSEIENILQKHRLYYTIVDVNLQRCTNIKDVHFYYLISL